MENTENTNAADTNTAEDTTIEVVVKKVGRPTMSNSSAQIKKAARLADEANGIFIKRGRPSASGTENKAAIARQIKAAKIAAGIEIKPGRPKGSTSSKPIVIIPASIDNVDELVAEDVVDVNAEN
jgi:hypothetical protein